MDKDATNRLKRSQSLLLHDSATSPPIEQSSKAKEAKSSGRHHRHHHKRHHHAHHLKNKGLNAQDSLESRIRSGMHALEEERKALREIVDEIEVFSEKDREDITCKFNHVLFFFNITHSTEAKIQLLIRFSRS